MLNRALEEAWFLSLSEVNDEDGRRAFDVLMREATFGDPEPHHIIDIVQRLKHERLMSPVDGSRWLKEAPKFYGEKDYFNPSQQFLSWLRSEQPKRYKACGADGEIKLIQNPEAWSWKVVGRQVHFIRPPAQSTGERIQTAKPNARRFHGA